MKELEKFLIEKVYPLVEIGTLFSAKVIGGFRQQLILNNIPQSEVHQIILALVQRKGNK